MVPANARELFWVKGNLHLSSLRKLLGVFRVAILPLVLASCSSNSASSSPTTTTVRPSETTTTSKPGLTPAMYAPDPKVTVTPSRNLKNGQKVTVSVTGFESGGKFFLSECASASDSNSAGCGHQLAAQPFGITNSSGRGSFPFTVTTEAGTKPYSKARAQCINQCVIVATVGINLEFAYAPIEFANR